MPPIRGPPPRCPQPGEVREQEQLWVSRGVTSVPTIVFNDQYAVSGGQPAEAFVGAIRQIINEAGRG